MEYEIYHHGVKGQKWGVRRYQNKDGTLTPAGKKRKSRKTIDEETAKKGAIKTAKILGKIGKVYLTDQIFFGGAGTNVVKTGVKYAGRAAVTAFVMARGGYDIRWYDN